MIFYSYLSFRVSLPFFHVNLPPNPSPLFKKNLNTNRLSPNIFTVPKKYPEHPRQSSATLQSNLGPVQNSTLIQPFLPSKTRPFAISTPAAFSASAPLQHPLIPLSSVECTRPRFDGMQRLRIDNGDDAARVVLRRCYHSQHLLHQRA